MQGAGYTASSEGPSWDGPIHTVNTNVRFSDVLQKGLDLQVGIYNLLDEEKQRTANPNRKGMPRLGREAFINAVYHW